MGEYATESPASVLARRKRRRSLITLAVVVLGLFFAFWYALSYYRADAGADAGGPSTSATCTPFDPDAVTPEKTKVNVYNATNRNGLAGSTAKAFESRGFVVDKVANDPTKSKTPAVAEVRHGAAGEAGANLVLSTMPEGTVLVVDKRKDEVVDVALGTSFTGLSPVATDAPPPMCPEPSASPSESPSP